MELSLTSGEVRRARLADMTWVVVSRLRPSTGEHRKFSTDLAMIRQNLPPQDRDLRPTSDPKLSSPTVGFESRSVATSHCSVEVEI